jgi:hypothetical protein
MAKENYRVALCVENKDCEDLEKRKIYQIIPDEDASREGYLRVIDESGEDYLYPQSYIVGYLTTACTRLGASRLHSGRAWSHTLLG